MSNNGTAPTPQQPLNRLTAAEMVKALSRVRQLTASTIQTPENQEQIEKDLAFLTKNFLDHAGEFVTYFFIIADEYETLLRAFSIVNRRLAQNDTTDEIPATPRT